LEEFRASSSCQFLISGSRGSESESKIRCSVEFSGVAGWTCEGKIRVLLWSDHCFEFMFQLTFWVARFYDRLWSDFGFQLYFGFIN
ncbi:hypothetical protein LINPERPRIM_LOCUS20983, partial [Linum perenne]